MPQAGEHLDLVGLELLPGAPAIALLPPAQIGVHRLPVDEQPRRQACEDRDERRAV